MEFNKNVNHSDNINPLLSFVIPTWNRQNELRECLDALIKEIESTKELIEIFVSDNGSTDSTPKILEEYSNKYNFIRYSCNEKNLGFDMNLIKAIENSRGKYIWTFADDDIIKEGALNKVIETINKYEPTYIAVNYDEFIIKNKNQFIIVKPDKITKYNRKILSSLWLNLNFKEILEKEFTRITYLNINIFKRSSINLNLLKNNIDKVKNYSHIFLVAQATINGGGVILPIVCVHKREDNSKITTSIFYKYLPDTIDFILSE
ncbi:MAG: glycosyltransferase family 2 protein, partial [Minisyncoccia bacterium]